LLNSHILIRRHHCWLFISILSYCDLSSWYWGSEWEINFLVWNLIILTLDIRGHLNLSYSIEASIIGTNFRTGLIVRRFRLNPNIIFIFVANILLDIFILSIFRNSVLLGLLPNTTLILVLILILILIWRIFHILISKTINIFCRNFIGINFLSNNFIFWLVLTRGWIFRLFYL